MLFLTCFSMRPELSGITSLRCRGRYGYIGLHSPGIELDVRRGSAGMRLRFRLMCQPLALYLVETPGGDILGEFLSSGNVFDDLL